MLSVLFVWFVLICKMVNQEVKEVLGKEYVVIDSYYVVKLYRESVDRLRT